MDNIKEDCSQDKRKKILKIAQCIAASRFVQSTIPWNFDAANVTESDLVLATLIFERLYYD
jgi:hypothetical protein